MNKKTLIFPYSLDNSSIIYNYLNQLNDVIVASVSGSATIGKTLSETLLRDISDNIIINIREVDFENIKKLIILNTKNCDYYFLIQDIIQKCIDCGIEIVSYTENVKKYCSKEFLKYMDFSVDTTGMYYDIDKPIVFIGGIKDTSENLWVSKLLQSSLKDRGIKAICISNYSFSIDLSVYPYPNEFNQKEISEEYKILLLNQYIRFLDKEINPDIFIIELLGGPMRFDNTVFNYFGLYYFLASQAVSGDYFICSVPIGIYDPIFFERLDSYIFKKFNFHIDVIHMINIQFEDHFIRTLGNDTEYFYISYKRLQKYLSENFENSKIGSLYNRECLENVVNDLLDKLEG